MAPKKIWQVFWDLQCPYSKVHWEHHMAICQQFESTYDFKIQLTSLLFHPQAFTAQCGASLIEKTKGTGARLAYINACFQNQEKFMNAAIGDARQSEVDAVFAKIAEEADVFGEGLTKKQFLEQLHDWEMAIKPAYSEHKIALSYGVYGTPKHVIDGKLVEDTESAWGPDEWTEKLKSLSK